MDCLGSSDTLVNVSSTVLLFVRSSPLLIKRVNTPWSVLGFVISHLKLSDDPLSKIPPVCWGPVLFKISPSDKVSKTNGDELVVPTGVPEPVGIS